MFDIWEFQRAVSRRLAKWAGISTALGLIMLLRRGFWRGVGGQFVGWAAVNLGIAVFGFLTSDHRRQQLNDPRAPAVLNKETRNLRRLLWINAGLDVLYMIGGGWLARRRASSPSRRGMGVGIILQGLFLFVFDVFHAQAVQPMKKATASASSSAPRGQ
ncbi:MAG: hypothetical protein IPK19_13505 [Chloroflexi bacterium]|nr:hypothetical protein [Chloroflexota bacterium]